MNPQPVYSLLCLPSIAASWFRHVAAGRHAAGFLAAWLFLATATAAYAQETEEERAQRLMRIPSQALAQAYLSNQYTLGLLGWAKQGATVHLSGADEQLTVTQANADSMIAEYEYRRDVYSRTIRARGYRDVAGDYRMTVARACQRAEYRELQPMTLSQDDFGLNLKPREGSEDDGISGVVVEDAVVFGSDDDTEYFVGGLSGVRIELRSSVNSRCTIALAPMDRPSGRR
jgi:hypothetical protein